MAPLHSPSLTLRILLICCALSVVSLLYVPLPLIPAIAKTYDIDMTLAAGVVSSFGFAYAAGFLIFGPLSDRVGRQNVIVPGLIILTLVTVALMWVSSLPLLLAGRAIQGFSAATFTPTAIAYLSERGSASQKRWSIAWMSTAFLSAGLLGQIYGETIVTRWGIAVAFIPLIAIYLLTAWRLGVTPPDERQTAMVPMLQVYQPVGAILKNPQLRRVYFPAFILLMCFVSFYMELDIHAKDQLLAWNTTSLAVRIYALPAFLLTLVAAVLIPRMGARRVVTAGLILAASGVLLAVSGVESHLPVLLTGNIIFVSGISVTVPGLIARIADEAESSIRGMAVAVYTFVLFLGASLGPSLALLTSMLTTRESFYVQVVLMGTAAIYTLTGQVKGRNTL
ncbi:MFS transporter [Enterobacteriaceae bacterium ML5]|nr:MFS transporter [Enterobacteriaceae bacterium ML5]